MQQLSVPRKKLRRQHVSMAKEGDFAMNRRLLSATALLLIVIAVIVLPLCSPTDEGWVMGYVSSDTPLYRSPTDAEPFAVLPAGTDIRWLSTTEDYAFGYIEAAPDGQMLRAYAPWDRLNITGDGTESDRALAFLRSAVGWTDEEIKAAGLRIHMVCMRNQFVDVRIRSTVHPDWLYDVWIDLLSDSLHDVQSPFTGAAQLLPEKTIRQTLRSGAFRTAADVQMYFIACYGAPETWSDALTQWAEMETGRYP